MNTKILFILFIVLHSFACRAVDGSDEFTPKDKPPFLFLSIETENRTSFERAPNGWFIIKFDPREGEIIHIGGKQIKSPKNIQGGFIEIGTFILHKYMSDTDFINTIKGWNDILYKSIAEPAAGN